MLFHKHERVQDFIRVQVMCLAIVGEHRVCIIYCNVCHRENPLEGAVNCENSSRCSRKLTCQLRNYTLVLGEAVEKYRED